MKVAPFADIAVALKLQARDLAMRTTDIEHVANSIGLFPATAARVVGEHRRQAELVADAYRIMRALMPVEQTMLAIIEQSGETA